MKKIKAHLQTLHLAALLVAATLLLACAGQPLEVQSIAKSENPQEVINKLDKLFQQCNMKISIILFLILIKKTKNIKKNKIQLLQDGFEK